MRDTLAEELAAMDARVTIKNVTVKNILYVPFLYYPQYASGRQMNGTCRLNEYTVIAMSILYTWRKSIVHTELFLKIAQILNRLFSVQVRKTC